MQLERYFGKGGVLAADEEGGRYRIEWAGKKAVFEEIAKRTACTLTLDPHSIKNLARVFQRICWSNYFKLLDTMFFTLLLVANDAFLKLHKVIILAHSFNVRSRIFPVKIPFPPTAHKAHPKRHVRHM